MCEAMYEQSPQYFKQFQKQFKYYVCNEPPKIPNESTFSYAYASSKEQNGSTYHVIIETDKLKGYDAVFVKGKLCRIPCLYSTYLLLIHLGKKRTVRGNVFTRLQFAVSFNEDYNKERISWFEKRLPLEAKSYTLKPTKTTSTQTSTIPSATIHRLFKILHSNLGNDMNLIMDTMLSGHGSLTTESPEYKLHFSLESTLN